MSDLPKLCYVKIRGARPGQRIGIIKRGKSGYYLTDFDHVSASDEVVKTIVNDFNKKLGVDAAEASAMECGSMMGWDVPGAKAEVWK